MLSGKSALLPLMTALTLFSIGGADMPSTPPQGVIDIKFGDFFKMPVGPLGLEPTEKLLGLDGRRVCIIGYLARLDAPTKDLLYLTPFPLELSDEDEQLADHLPPTTVFVPMPSAKHLGPYSGSLIRLTGRLSVGPKEEPDGRVSTVRLIPDPDIATALTGSPRALENKQTIHVKHHSVQPEPVQ